MLDRQADHVAQRLALRGGGVVQQGTGGGQRGRQRLAAEGHQAGHAQLLAQAARAGLHVEVPVRQARAGDVVGDGVERGVIGQHFGRADALELAVELFRAALHQPQFAADEVEPCQADQRRGAALARDLRDGEQVVVDLVGQQCRIGQRAGRDHTHDLALDRALGGGRVADLFADGNRFAQLDQLGQVLLDRVERHAGHADRQAVGGAARGQRDVEQARGLFGVFEEQFVEVAHPVEDKRMGMRRFQLEILLHHRRVLVEGAVFRVDLQSRCGVFSHAVSNAWHAIDRSRAEGVQSRNCCTAAMGFHLIRPVPGGFRQNHGRSASRRGPRTGCRA
nr:hypothetical protein [Ralstonia solanacearum]